MDVQLQPGSAADQAAVFAHDLPTAALRLADLGYWRLAELHRLDQEGVFWLSRLQTQTAVVVAGKRCDVTTLLAAQPQPHLDLPLYLGVAYHLPARLLAVRVLQEVADQRQRRLRAAAKRKGRTVSAARLSLAA